MRALVTLSHGSRHPHAEAGVVALTRVAGELAGTPSFAAHLEFNSPDLTTTCVRLAELGYTEAVVVPLLFTSAYHHTHDVPEAIAAARVASGIEVTLAASLGLEEDLAELMAQRIAIEAPCGAHVALLSVGSSDAEANAAVSRFAATVSEKSGNPVTSIKITGTDTSTIEDLAPAVSGKYIHVLPLFVSDGLLLDRVLERMPQAEKATFKRITHSLPLTTALAGIVAHRFTATVMASA